MTITSHGAPRMRLPFRGCQKVRRDSWAYWMEYPCERFCFQVQGYNIPIRSEILANALVKLSEKKRDMLTVRFLRLQKGKMTEYFGWIDNYQLALPKLTTRILKIRPLTCAVCAQSRRSFFIPKIKNRRSITMTKLKTLDQLRAEKKRAET